MGWAVGEDWSRHRHIGYGVPATCDHPGCGEEIDRGLAFACGGGVATTLPEETCGLFFCGSHLSYFIEDENDGGASVCERCAKHLPPFEPTPDTAEWVEHVLTDESWAEFRETEPVWLKTYQDRAQALGLSV